jgi:hypothetical protein
MAALVYYAGLPLRLHSYSRDYAVLLQLLILQLTLQLLRLSHFAYRLVEVVLVDSIAIIFDGEQATAPN